MPVVFVSNMEVEDLVGSARKKAPGFMSGVKALPDIAVETVPMGKDAADRFIERHVSPGDIVLTDDNDLTAKCVNKGALAIDYRGRALECPSGYDKVGKKDVARMKPKSRKKKPSATRFRASLLQAVR